MASPVKSTEYLKKNWHQSFTNFQKIEEEGKFPNPLYKSSITLMPKSDAN